MHETWERATRDGWRLSVRDFAVLDTLGHGDFGSVFVVRYLQGVCAVLVDSGICMQLVPECVASVRHLQ